MLGLTRIPRCKINSLALLSTFATRIPYVDILHHGVADEDNDVSSLMQVIDIVDVDVRNQVLPFVARRVILFLTTRFKQ